MDTIKHIIFYLLLAISSLSLTYAQGDQCSQMGPICTDAGLNFTASTGVTDADLTDPGNNYGCLSSSPNPSWYYLEISANGDIEMELSAANDVDFALWGPFSSLSAAQASCNSYGSPTNDFGGTWCSTLGICDFYGCSYDASNVETPGIQSAQVGEVYVMLITNYDNSIQDITLTQTGGNGATDCSIVTNNPCTMNTLTADVVSCSSNPYLEFAVGGTVTYTDPPTSGQLIIEDCYGQQQSFGPPFGTSMSYTITGLPQDGLDCNITAYFTNDAGCTITTPVTAPSPITYFSSNCTIGGGAMDGTIEFSGGHTGANLIVEVTDGVNTVQDIIPMPASSPQNWSVTGLDPAANPYDITYYFDDNPTCSQSQTVNCGCSADAGTVTTTQTGDGNTNYVLCYNDQIDLVTNYDFVDPDDIGPLTDQNGNSYAFSPALLYVVYSCQPTPGIWPPQDPCFVTLLGIEDAMYDINDNVAYSQILNGGPYTDLWFAPTNVYSWDGTTAVWNSNCWDVGDAVQVTYLNEITFSETTDCNAGTATITVTGGLPELDGTSSFTASNVSPSGATLNNTTCTNGGTIVIGGLQNGDMYSFDVIDDNGCPVTYTGGPFVGVPVADAGSDDNVCSLTYTLAANPSFGTGTWTSTGGATFSNASSPTSNVTVSSAGSYTFTWTESNGGSCADSDDVIIQFSNLQYTDVTNDPSCGNPDGDITLSGNSGITAYSYSIDGGTTTQASGAFTGLTSGNYNIVVEDALGCQVTGTITLTDLGGPTIDAINSNDITCNTACNGDISISATGATQFSIDNGANFSTVNTFNNLCAGSYDIITQDALGCQASGTVTLVEPDPLTHTTTQTDLLCANDCNGQINISETGGSSPYQYSVDNGSTNQSTGSFQNLCVGTYDVLVTDANNCTTSSTVTLVEPSPLSVTIGITDASCYGMCDGMMNSIPSGGTGSGTYNYSWTPAVAGNVPFVTNLCAGSYSLSVTDGNGCTLDTTGIIVGAPQAVTIDNISTADETCGGSCDGSLTINSTGGTEYSMDGSSYGANNTFSNLCAGTYTVYAQDVNGCSATDQVDIIGPPPVTVVADGSTTICIGQTTTLTSIAGGGVGGYTYSWDNGGTTQNINVTPTASQSYCVVATDANGCPSSSSCATVNLNPPLSVIALSDQSICEGDNASITAIGNGGNGGPYTYTWDQGVGTGQTQSVSPLFTTDYTVTLSDGCTTPNATAGITITVNTIPNISFSADNFDGCYPVSVNFTEMNVPTGSSCLWTFGDGGASTDCNNPNYSFENPGCWDVTLEITTPDGCEATSTINDYICVYDYPDPYFTFGPQPTTILEPLINFTNLTDGATDYTWSLDPTSGAQSTTTNPSYSYGDVGSFEVCLDALSSEGCPAQYCDTVVILEEFVVYVPNAFTPDGDAVNNEFLPIISGVMPDSYEFMVFNRWGELIFQSQVVGQGWDGTYKNVMSQEDVYVWKLKVDDQLGETHQYIGHVTLLK